MKIIFTNGCFDVLHAGHVKLLEYCYSLAHKTPGGSGKVVVGLNSDDSVKRIKGSHRPFNCESDRVCVLEALRYVDEVTIFNEDTPHNLIDSISPDVIVKGGDYTKGQVIGGRDYEVKIFDYIPNLSSTNILKKVNEDMLD